MRNTVINVINNTNNISGVSDIINVHMQSFTENGYTVIKINREKQSIYKDISIHNIDIVHLSIIFALASVMTIIFIIRYMVQNKGIISLKVKVKTRLIGDSYTSSTNNELTNNNELSYKRKDKEIYILARSMAKYSDSLLIQFFRTLCGIGMNVIVLLEKYPSEEASKIIGVVRSGELNECVQLKYISDSKNLKSINIMEVDEILEMLNLQLSSRKDVYADKDNGTLSSRETVHEYNIGKQKQSDKSRYVIVFGRRGRYFIRKELYDVLKRGISLEELRKKYDDKTYNLVMNMYSDGIIIMSNGKVFLID